MNVLSAPVNAELRPGQYQCPGESQSISEAVHLGRLASGYAGCESCVWRFEHRKEEFHPAAAPPDTHSRIRRTQFGIRGRYLNAIDRSVAAAFTTMMISGTRSGSGLSTIAVGYEGGLGAPDLFAGVLPAAQQNSATVFDAGQCSAASLSHCLRSHSEVEFGLLVTSESSFAGEVGIDVISCDGRALSIPFGDFGIGTDRDDSGNWTLKLPEQHSHFSPRSRRHSGDTMSVASEANYHRWVRSWWPQDESSNLTLKISPTANEQRLNFLQQLSPRLVVGNQHRPSDSEVIVSVGHDDRFATVQSRRGHRVPAERLAAWMNQCERRTARHVTAHVTPDDRVFLMDAAAPHSGESQQPICDGLALAGFVATLTQHNPLPQ